MLTLAVVFPPSSSMALRTFGLVPSEVSDSLPSGGSPGSVSLAGASWAIDGAIMFKVKSLSS